MATKWHRSKQCLTGAGASGQGCSSVIGGSPTLRPSVHTMKWIFYLEHNLPALAPIHNLPPSMEKSFPSMENSFRLSLRLAASSEKSLRTGLWGRQPSAAFRGLARLSAASHCSSLVCLPQLLVQGGAFLLAVCVPSLPRAGMGSGTLS